MIQKIRNCLDSTFITEILIFLNECEFVDGSNTAGEIAARVKNNLQAKGAHSLMANIEQALRKQKEVTNRNFPLGFGTGVLNKYDEGMFYGPHYDNKYMRVAKGTIRADLSMTLFLNEDFEGGELVIDGITVQPERNKLVIYPADQLHSVNPVTSGTRLAYVNWFQSCIEDHYDRVTVASVLEAMERTETFEMQDRLSEVYNRLMRRFSSL